MMTLSRPYFVVKTNANFPGNPSQRGLPTIQGLLLLFDAECGSPLAVMDSMSVTRIRTAAASAVAAKHLSRRDARNAVFIGCGVQARPHVAAISAVRTLELVYVYDIDAKRAEVFADELRAAYPFNVEVARNMYSATKASDIIVTLTSAMKAFVGPDDVPQGAFVAAVGADNEHKQEIEPELLRGSALVVDDLEQCAAIGDLRAAIQASVLSRKDVRATLAEVVAGVKQGRLNDDETVVFDSTGVAIEDVAAAAIVYERASANDGVRVDFGE